VIVVHGLGVHPDRGLINPLRSQLAEQGYATLPVQMPVLAKWAIRWVDGRIVQMHFATDITARKDAEEDSRQQREKVELFQREREVMDRVIEGKPNKCIAKELGISIKTVEAHRARMMGKLDVGSVAELVRLSIGWNRPQPTR
jgi:DNA-binding CsgD family transcriptional regulator